MEALGSETRQATLSGGSGGSTTMPGRLKTLGPGVTAAVVVGAVAYLVSMRTPAMSPLIWAIVVGATLANVTRLPAVLAPGIAFAAKNLLRLAVGLLGVRLGLSQILEVGPKGVAIVIVAVGATFVFTRWLSARFGLSTTLGTVLAAGTSICGAAAVVAVAGVVDSKEEETAVGVGAITALGTLAMLSYPLVGQALGMSADAFGVWAGASIHEVAQVVAAGFSFGALDGSAVETATVVKLGRVLTLAPMAVMLSFAVRGKTDSAGKAKVSPVPWFIVLFLAMVAVRSLGVLPERAVSGLVTADTMLLAVAMAGLGLDLRWAKVRAAGVKPIYVASIATVFMGALTLGLVYLLGV